MKMKRLLILLALIYGVSVSAQESGMTMLRAKSLVPRQGIEPVKSLIPSARELAVDTLETSDPRVKMVLRSDHTWDYVKDPEMAIDEQVFKEGWNHNAVSTYKVPYDQLPIRMTLWLVDSTSQFCVPNQVKVFSKFGYRRSRNHTGVDLPLQMGKPVYAAFSGKVRVAQRSGGYGNLVIIRHSNALETYYGHLSQIDVQEDQWVDAGQVIGLGGSTGRSTGPHLHFETRYKGYCFDPQWIIDFENGVLKRGVFVLHRKYLTPGSTYVPESEDEADAIYQSEEEERAEEERIARELAAAQYYKIRSGDTLGGIAIKYHTSVNAICKLNGITPKTTLKIGRTIRVK